MMISVPLNSNTVAVYTDTSTTRPLLRILQGGEVDNGAYCPPQATAIHGKEIKVLRDFLNEMLPPSPDKKS